MIVFRISGVWTNDMHRNEKSTRQTLICRLFVRLFVIFCLWQGPVPWLHCHDSELIEPTSAASSEELRYHLLTFHDGMALDQDHEFGWHFHWILPGWSDGFHELSNDGQPVKGFASLDSIVPGSISPASCSRLFVGDLCLYRSGLKFNDDNRIISSFERCRILRRQHQLPLVMRC